MARAARKKSVSGIYHVMLRGINRQTIFYDDEDREVFLSRLKIVKEKSKYDMYAFCFMSNHIHLLLKEKEISISAILRKVLSSYVFWYNSKYERVGNLFQDRYKSEPIESDEHLLCAVRYIHQNPVKAEMVDSPRDYPWSSYSAYISENKGMIETSFVLGMLQGKEQYESFMEKREEIGFLELDERIRITDDKLVKAIKSKLGIKEMNEIEKLTREELSEKIPLMLSIDGSNPYQISRVTGISMGVIRAILQ